MSHKILVVEDEADLLDLVVYNLRKEGFKPIRAETGEKALELARTEKPDLVLLDLMMPGPRRPRGAAGGCARTRRRPTSRS